MRQLAFWCAGRFGASQGEIQTMREHSSFLAVWIFSILMILLSGGALITLVAKGFS